MNQFLKYLISLQAQHKNGQTIQWDRQYCDTLQHNILAEINVESKEIQQIKYLIQNVAAFIHKPETTQTTSRQQFYASLNSFYNQANQMHLTGELQAIVDHYKQDIMLFEKFMSTKFPIDNAFFFWINENRQNLNKAMFTQGFFQFLQKCKEGNSGRRTKYENILILLIALAIANDDNNYVNVDKYMQTYGIDDKFKEKIIQLASGGKTKAYNILLQKIQSIVQEIQQEVYSVIIKRFFEKKERKHMREITRIEKNLDISHAEVRKIQDLFRWDKNYTWKELDQKIKVTQNIVKEQKRVA